MNRNNVILLIIVLGVILIPQITNPTKNNQNILNTEVFNTELKADRSKPLLSKISSLDSVQAIQGFCGTGTHYMDIDFYMVVVYNDHEAIGKGEWYFRYKIFYPYSIPTYWFPFDDEHKVDGPSTIELNYGCYFRMVGDVTTDDNTKGFYSIQFWAYEHELGITDPQSVSKTSIGFEFQGIRYSNNDFPSQIPGDEEVNHWIYEDIRDNDVRFFVRYYLQNSVPTARTISPLNPTIFVGNSIVLMGDGTDSNGDSLEYEWDLDYDGVTFDVDATTRTVTTSFSEGVYRVAYRVKDPFYGQYTPASNIQETLITVNPSDAPFIDQPEELFIERGTTGNNITWSPYDENPDQYAITRINASNMLASQIIIAPTTWDNDSITLDVDNYPLGTYYFTCAVEDYDGHTSSSTVTFHVIEKDDPIIDLPPQSLVFIEDSFDNFLTWNATDENPTSFTISRNNTIIQEGAWNGSEITTSLSTVPAGTYLYNCTVIDQFGNSKSSDVVIEVIDINPPRIQISVTNRSSLLPGTSITNTIIDNHVGGAYFNWDDQPNQSVTASTFQTSFPGTKSQHSLTIYAYDLAGNYITEKYTFYTDITSSITTTTNTTTASTNSYGLMFTLISVGIITTIMRKRKRPI